MRVIYLDIDGPLNVHSNQFMPIGNSDNWKDYCKLGSFNVYSPAMVQSLNELIEAHELTIVLASTWENSGQDFASKIGLLNAYSWEALPAHESDMIEDEWLKLDSVKEHFERFSPEKAVWIDDDLPHQKNALTWAAECNIKLLAPDTITGITPSMIGDLNLYFENSPYPDLNLDLDSL